MSDSLLQDSFSVSELNENARQLLEQCYGTTRVHGEISGMTLSASGHRYFTLKDAHSMIRCVFFRFQAAHCKAKLEDGAQVVVHGKLTLYVSRGSYQIQVSQVESYGIGALLAQMEQLKTRLQQEGLFDAEGKKKLPAFPQNIGIVTSQQGAVIRDLITTFANRMPMIRLWVFHCQVEGIEAAPSIVQALERANSTEGLNVLILARGGGSFESLLAFNSEDVVRAVARCTIPVVSAVGHETDTSLVDWVADARAATPTAAAVMLSPSAQQLLVQIKQHEQNLQAALFNRLQNADQRLTQAMRMLTSPERLFAAHRQRLVRLEQLLRSRVTLNIARHSQRFMKLEQRLRTHHPVAQLERQKQKLGRLTDALRHQVRLCLAQQRERLNLTQLRLKERNPRAVLKAGYAIVLTDEEAPRLVSNARSVVPEAKLKAILNRGTLKLRVTESLHDGRNAPDSDRTDETA